MPYTYLLQNPVILSLFFGFGIVTRSLFLIKSKKEFKQILIYLLISLIGLFPGKREVVYNLYTHIFYCFCLYIFVIAIFFKEKLLPEICEASILQLSLVFLYTFFIYYYNTDPFLNIVLLIILIPTIAIFILSFLPIVLTFFWKLIFYVWFLLINTLLIWSFFSLGNLSLFFQQGGIQNLTPISSFLTGSAFFYLATGLIYLYLLIPIPGKHQSMENRIKEWKALVHLMVKKHTDIQTTWFQALFIILLEGGILLLNYFYHFISPNTLILVILFTIPLVESFLKNKAIRN